MKARFLIGAIAAAALLLPAAGAHGQRDTSERRGGERRSDGPDRRDWTNTAAPTPEGGIRMGDPDAPVKVIVYVSLISPENVLFLAAGGERLYQHYVRSGRVSVEYRNHPQNAFDLAGAMLSRCATPRQYFNMTHYLLSHQPEWMGRAQALTDAQRNELRGVPMIQALQRIVPMIGLDRVAARHGISAADQRICMADQAALDGINARMQAAQGQHNVRGAPVFVVNGQSVGAQTWATLEPMLRDR